MIPAQISADLATLSASVQAAAPIRQATPLTKAALVAAGASLIVEVETALAAAIGGLDGVDPTGYPAALVSGLLALGTASYDQATLAEMRGTVGRAVFNLRQA